MFKKEISARVVSACALAIALLAILFSNIPYLFWVLMAFFCIIGSFEYNNAVKNLKIDPYPALFYIQTIAIFTCSIFREKFDIKFVFLVFIIFNFLFLIVSLILKNTSKQKLGLFNFLHLFWVVFPLYITSQFIHFPKWNLLILFLTLIITFSDIFAYFGGKKFGKHLLASKISPKKTLEGSFIGLIGGAGTGIVFSYVVDLFTLSQSVIFALILAIFSQLGDLVESKFKRYCNIKDSGNILPGHGGLLDRIDSFLISSPIFFLLLINKDLF